MRQGAPAAAPKPAGGPSPARLAPAWRPSPQAVLSLVLVGLALSMQGCFHNAFKTHALANWRAKPNYLMTYAFDAGGTTGSVLNSCSVERMDTSKQCNGRGTCQNAFPENMANEMYFCKCDPEWADPECGTPRKSHMKAFAFSCFFGFLGADLFYLEQPIWGFLKLITFGGGGVWWMLDIVRVGSARVYAKNFRVSDDLPHWMFTMLASIFSLLLGFAISTCAIAQHIHWKRQQRDEDVLRHGSHEHHILQDKMSGGKIV